MQPRQSLLPARAQLRARPRRGRPRSDRHAGASQGRRDGPSRGATHDGFKRPTAYAAHPRIRQPCHESSPDTAPCSAQPQAQARRTRTPSPSGAAPVSSTVNKSRAGSVRRQARALRGALTTGAGPRKPTLQLPRHVHTPRATRRRSRRPVRRSDHAGLLDPATHTAQGRFAGPLASRHTPAKQAPFILPSSLFMVCTSVRRRYGGAVGGLRSFTPPVRQPPSTALACRPRPRRTYGSGHLDQRDSIPQPRRADRALAAHPAARQAPPAAQRRSACKHASNHASAEERRRAREAKSMPARAPPRHCYSNCRRTKH